MQACFLTGELIYTCNLSSALYAERAPLYVAGNIILGDRPCSQNKKTLKVLHMQVSFIAENCLLIGAKYRTFENDIMVTLHVEPPQITSSVSAAALLGLLFSIHFPISHSF